MDHTGATLEEPWVADLSFTAFRILAAGFTAAALASGPAILPLTALSATPPTTIIAANTTHTIGETGDVDHFVADGAVSPGVGGVRATR